MFLFFCCNYSGTKSFNILNNLIVVDILKVKPISGFQQDGHEAARISNEQ